MSALAAPEPTLPPFVSDEDARLMLAMKLFETGRLSLGQAAQMAAYSKQGFMDVLGHHGSAVVNYPASDLAKETAW